MKSIILAGGSGSRLWPLSREGYPKQLLSMDENYSTLQQTFMRVLKLAKPEDIVTITNVKQFQDIKLQLNKINKNSVVIAEPQSKNTAPAIAGALKYFTQICESDEIVLVVPSDHLINDTESFVKSIESGVEYAKQNYIVTFGVKPLYAETGYGYIKTNGYKVVKFDEKPNDATAKTYLEDDSYYWNSGIFMGKISVFLDEYKKYAPEIYSEIQDIKFTSDKKIPFVNYENMPFISIDYSIMEKSDNLAFVELKSDWNDLGSWQQLYKLKQKDENSNVTEGKVVLHNVKNSFIYSQKELVAVSDLDDVVIVETEDAIMACKMSKAQNVKHLYEHIKEHANETTLLHKTVFRPWGYYTCMNSGKGYLTKTICVLPNQKLSVQSHNYRSEHWVVLEGRALVIKDEKEYYLNAGDSIDIPLKAKHSLQNPYDEELKVIEVQKGDYLSEDDIIRYEDCYGRV